MTTIVTIHEAKTHLSRLIQRALAGEEIVIARGQTPLVRLTVVPEAQPQRRLAGAAGVIVQMDADFDAPLPDFEEYMP
ncbi:MAG: type II toxin-antitoxin system Phd/YefM family antitoxin [Caldilineaceae bacterium]|jgi:antitoxin (DNA-binding transcriptional repressor) of toxin-antitoxin stability system|nr:type II toxin-antitoxin system Phd/YefM family antitoxin [Caldilineaceae bacterium]